MLPAMLRKHEDGNIYLLFPPIRPAWTGDVRLHAGSRVETVRQPRLFPVKLHSQAHLSTAFAPRERPLRRNEFAGVIRTDAPELYSPRALGRSLMAVAWVKFKARCLSRQMASSRQPAHGVGLRGLRSAVGVKSSTKGRQSHGATARMKPASRWRGRFLGAREAKPRSLDCLGSPPHLPDFASPQSAGRISRQWQSCRLEQARESRMLKHAAAFS